MTSGVLFPEREISLANFAPHPRNLPDVGASFEATAFKPLHEARWARQWISRFEVRGFIEQSAPLIYLSQGSTMRVQIPLQLISQRFRGHDCLLQFETPV